MWREIARGRNRLLGDWVAEDFLAGTEGLNGRELYPGGVKISEWVMAGGFSSLVVLLVMVGEVTSEDSSSLPWYVTADVHLVLSNFSRVSLSAVFF